MIINSRNKDNKEDIVIIHCLTVLPQWDPFLELCSFYLMFEYEH